jgi:hypothetical protein
MENRSGIAKPSRSEASQTKASQAKVPQSKADELEERLIDFAVRIIKLTSGLPKTNAEKHIAGQILRSGTSPAPNYGEARGAESTADLFTSSASSLKS